MSLVAGPAPAVVAALAAIRLPGSIEEARLRRLRHRRSEAWPDLLSSLRSRLAAGDDISTALVASADGLLTPIAEAVDRGRRQGRSLMESLQPLRDEWKDPIADRVVVTLAAASRAGGTRVSDVVATLGDSVADELRLRRAHDAETTQQRLTSIVALAAPWILLAFSIATNPQAAEAFDTPSGSAVIVGGGLATALGHALARRTVRLSAPVRVFR